MKNIIKITSTVVWVAGIFMAIGWIFWSNEWKYNLPTPVPVSYKTVEMGSVVKLADNLTFNNNKPTFIHFFNPDCPCSRFNLPHVRSLIKKYGTEVNFGVVVLENENEIDESTIQQKLGADIPVCFDKAIAQQCGVYSTPQAVLLTADHKIYYRGNYNKSRYCTNPGSNYAQMAIDSFLNNIENPIYTKSALTSYGCVLPNCTK